MEGIYRNITSSSLEVDNEQDSVCYFHTGQLIHKTRLAEPSKRSSVLGKKMMVKEAEEKKKKEAR